MIVNRAFRRMHKQIAVKFAYRYRVSVFLFFLILITFMDRVCISLVGVRIKSAFNLTNEQFGWVLGAFALAYAIFEIPTGTLGDRIGQRAVFIRIVLWWSLFTALTGAATGLGSLVITRFLFGAGEAGAYPTCCGTISRWFPAGETAKGISCLMIGSSTGAAIAPLIIIPIAVSYGWRAPFFVNGLIGLVWVLICISWFRNEPAEMKRISKDERQLIETSRRFVKHGKSFPWKIAFKNRTMWLLIGASFSSQWAFYFFIAWLPVYLQEGRHFSESSMKIITSYLFVIGTIGGISSGFFSDWLVKKRGLKFGRRYMGMLTLVMMGLLFFLAAIVENNAIATGCLMFCYFFVPIHGITAFSACVDIGGSKAGTVTGIMNFFGQIGAFSLAVIFGRIVDLTHSFNAPLYIVSFVLLAGSLTWMANDLTKKIPETIDH
jgi:ACS family glucarate transporter-like MFS transporter